MRDDSLSVAGVSFDALRLIFGGAGILIILAGIFRFLFLREPPLPAEVRATPVSQTGGMAQN